MWPIHRRRSHFSGTSYDINFTSLFCDFLQQYTGAPIVGIARWSVPRIGQGHLEVKW